jgi:hypothetical protein
LLLSSPRKGKKDKDKDGVEKKEKERKEKKKKEKFNNIMSKDIRMGMIRY